MLNDRDSLNRNEENFSTITLQRSVGNILRQILPSGKILLCLGFIYIGGSFEK